MDGWDGWMDGRTDRRMDEWMNEWVNGCAGVSKHVSVHIWKTGALLARWMDRWQGAWKGLAWLVVACSDLSVHKKIEFAKSLYVFKFVRKRSSTKFFFLFTCSFPHSQFPISFPTTSFTFTTSWKPSACTQIHEKSESRQKPVTFIERHLWGKKSFIFSARKVAIIVSVRHLKVSSERGSDVSNATNKCIQ